MKEKDTIAILEIYKWRSSNPDFHDMGQKTPNDASEILTIQYSSEDYPTQKDFAEKLEEEIRAYLKKEKLSFTVQVGVILEKEVGEFFRKIGEKKLNAKTTRRFILYLDPESL